jgi:dolichol kinase
MNNYLLGLIYSFLFLGCLFLLEIITRRKNFKREFTRRIAHVSSGIFGLIMGYVLEPKVFIVSCLLFLIVISFSYLVNFFSSIHGVKRKTYGEIFLPIGIIIAYLISNGPNVNYLSSILILTISDPLSGVLVDLKPSYKNSIFSFIVFFISTMVILLTVYGQRRLVIVILFSVLIAITERISSLGTDNLSIPLISSILLRIFKM